MTFSSCRLIIVWTYRALSAFKLSRMTWASDNGRTEGMSAACPGVISLMSRTTSSVESEEMIYRCTFGSISSSVSVACS